ncbi:hypothetical protein PMAYCL1PPCAC_29867, partial [Pristionchus mayeri]
TDHQSTLAVYGMYVFQPPVVSSFRPMMVKYRIHYRSLTVSQLKSEVNIFLVCSVIFLIAMIAVLLYVLVLLYRYTSTPDPLTVSTRLANETEPHDIYISPKKEAMANAARVCDNHDSNVPPQIVMIPSIPPPEYQSLEHRLSICASPLPTYDELMRDSTRSTRIILRNT